MTWAAVRAGSVDPNLADSTLAPHQVRRTCHTLQPSLALGSGCSPAQHSTGRCSFKSLGPIARLSRSNLALFGAGAQVTHRRGMAC